MDNNEAFPRSQWRDRAIESDKREMFSAHGTDYQLLMSHARPTPQKRDLENVASGAGTNSYRNGGGDAHDENADATLRIGLQEVRVS